MGYDKLYLLPIHASLDWPYRFRDLHNETNTRCAEVGDCDAMVDICDAVVLRPADH